MFDSAGGGRILSVRMNEKCPHGNEAWEKRACGHPWCPLCGGNVDVQNRTVVPLPTPVITCNRSVRFDEYRHLFGENFAGQANLSAAMEARLDEGRVRAAEDILVSERFDLLDDKVYARKVSSTKRRDCLYEHF